MMTIRQQLRKFFCNTKQNEAIIKYVDAKIEYELASIEEDEDGYRGVCVTERKAMEAAKEELMKA